MLALVAWCACEVCVFSFSEPAELLDGVPMLRDEGAEGAPDSAQKKSMHGESHL